MLATCGASAACSGVDRLRDCGPIFARVADAFGSMVEGSDAGLLPWPIFVEVAKVLFLNNAINHGVLTPLGTEDGRDRPVGVLHA